MIKPTLSIQADGASFHLEFPSQTNVIYTIHLSVSPSEGFSMIGSVAGIDWIVR